MRKREGTGEGAIPSKLETVGKLVILTIVKDIYLFPPPPGLSANKTFK